jgi:short-subunit dehydrogenase
LIENGLLVEDQNFNKLTAAMNEMVTDETYINNAGMQQSAPFLLTNWTAMVRFDENKE